MAVCEKPLRILNYNDHLFFLFSGGFISNYMDNKYFYAEEMETF